MTEISTSLTFISFLGTALSIFSFCICLYVAKTLGYRLQRERLLGEIIGIYCEIREFNTRCKIFLDKLRPSFKYQLLGSLPTDFQKVYSDTSLVFLEAFKSNDYEKLQQTKKALNSISSRLHSIMCAIEIRIRKVEL